MCVISEGATIAGEDGGDGDLPGRRASAPTSASATGSAGRSPTRLGDGVVIQELAYLMRSGEPDAMDRMVGFAFGGLAVQLLQRGETARMVTLTDGNYGHVPIDTLLKGTKSVDVSALYDKADLPRPADAGRGHADVPVLRAGREALLEAPLLPTRRLPPGASRAVVAELVDAQR